MTHPQTQDDEALVEAMARAICRANGEGPDEVVRSIVGSAAVLQWRLYEPDAEAALTALRNHEGRK